MSKVDLLLLHPPSIYDFRSNTSLYGPISDVIPSTPIFEMYPIGYVSIAGYLEKMGFHVRIINLALKMLRNPRFDVGRALKKSEPAAFGLDLHWLVHAHGGLEVVKLVKDLHPETPTIVGGLSATYYHREIISNHPYIDYVLRGDSTEEPLNQLLSCIESGSSPIDIPNLTWRDGDGQRHINPLTYVPQTLDDTGQDYTNMADLVLKHRDLEGNLPYDSWMDYPFTALLTCKGCIYNCVTCGGSKRAYSRFFGRRRPAFKSPQKILEEMRIISDYFKSPIFLLGDITQAGKRHAYQILDLIGKEGIDNPIVLEMFNTPPKEFLEKVAKSCSTFSMEISPESHDEEVRSLQGRRYNNTALEKTVENALNLGCEKMDVFFMIGLPKQTLDSAMETVEYCRLLVERYGKDGRVHPFIAPLAPFLDPGSLAFESPEEYGYQRLYTTLREHRDALEGPSWKYFLNYQTRWMSRDEIVQATYGSMYLLNELKRQYGIIDKDTAEKMAHLNLAAQSIMDRIDQIQTSTTDKEERRRLLRAIGKEINMTDRAYTYAEKELRIPGEARINKRAALKYILQRIKRR